MSRAWRFLATAVVMTAVLSGCVESNDPVVQAPADRASSSASPAGDWRIAASEALSEWEDFPVDAEVRPIVLLQETVGPSGFRSDDGKIAFMSGNWSNPDPMPASPAEADGYPVISASAALEVLRVADGAGEAEPQGARMSVADMRLGSVEVRTDRGPTTLPAWRVMFDDSTGPTWIPAVASPASYEHDGPYYFDGGAETTAGGRELTFHTGVPAGSGRCGGKVSVEVVESAQALAYRLVVVANPRSDDSDYGCAFGGDGGQDVTVTLAAPLGNRILLNVPAANDVRGPVPVAVRD